MAENKSLSLLGRVGKLLKWVDSNLNRPFLQGGSRLFATFAGITLVALAIMIVMDVVARKTSIRLPWITNFEIEQIGMALLSCLALSWCWNIGAHVRIELLIDRLGSKAQAVLSIFAALINIVCVGILSWQLLRMGSRNIEHGQGTLILGIPIGPFQIIFAIVMIHFALMLLRSIWSYINKARGRSFEKWSCDMRDWHEAV